MVTLKLGDSVAMQLTESFSVIKMSENKNRPWPKRAVWQAGKVRKIIMINLYGLSARAVLMVTILSSFSTNR